MSSLFELSGIELNTPEDIAKWREERKAKFPRVKLENSTTNDDGSNKKTITKKKRNRALLNDTSRNIKISLFDKMLLTEVWRKEDEILRCLKLLADEWSTKDI